MPSKKQPKKKKPGPALLTNRVLCRLMDLMGEDAAFKFAE